MIGSHKGPHRRNTVVSMRNRWWEYVQRTADTTRQRDISERTGIDATNVTRWKSGQIPKAETVAHFARTYGRPVLEAFVAAGFLTEAEAKVRPAAAPSLSALSDDELLAETKRRLDERRTITTLAPGSGKTESIVERLRAQIGDMSVAEVEVVLDQTLDLEQALRSILASRESPEEEPRVLYEAARTVGRQGSAGQRRDEQDRAGEPPANNPNDMEPR